MKSWSDRSPLSFVGNQSRDGLARFLKTVLRDSFTDGLFVNRGVNL